MTLKHLRLVKVYTLTLLIALLMLSGTADGQKRKRVKTKKAAAEMTGRAVMWEPVNIGTRDLFYGPGGSEMEPDLSRVTFVKKESGGANKKYRIRDAAGRTWIAKLGVEARPETAAVRLLYGIGYKTEVNYLVPTITIPGKGTFRNVRLELRPDNVERKGEWKWKQNRFSGTQEFQGLKIMQIFMTNWDVLDKQNEILEVQTPRGKELHFIISDLGRTFGKYGNNNLPIIYRLGRKTGSPKAYSKASFVKGFDDDGRIRWGIKGKNRGIYRDVTVGDARWLLDKLSRLSDSQIADAFRAANYSPAEVDMYRTAVKRRIRELTDLVSDDRFARRE